MKKVCKSIASLMVAFTFIFSTMLTATAADSAVVYEGGAENYVFLQGSNYTDTDLFDNFKNVMPGDIRTEKINVKNENSSCDYVKIYMRAATHDENSNPLTYSEAFENADGKDQANISGQRDETIATMTDFLSQLSMKIWNGNQLIYEASPDELDGLQNNVLLGEFEAGESTELTVELSVPIELGNEYTNRVGEVDWVFVAEEITNPPAKTGDSANILLPFILLVASIAVITRIIYRNKKQNI